MLYYIGNSLSLSLSLLRGSVFPLPVICGNVLQYVSDMSITPDSTSQSQNGYLLGGYIPTFGRYYHSYTY